MPQPETLLKAILQEISWEGEKVKDEGQPVSVQFNPETLKVSFANQKAGGKQQGNDATQYVGTGSTKLSFELWFDATVSDDVDDVRKLTQGIVHFITPKKTGNKDKKKKYAAPGVRFLWGTFLFEGTVDSLNENLEFFSEEAKPLRASVSVAMSKQEIQFQFGSQQPPNQPPAPGVDPLAQAQEGDTVQDVAAKNGQGEDWQPMARQNNVENPRHPEPGTPLTS